MTDTNKEEQQNIDESMAEAAADITQDETTDADALNIAGQIGQLTAERDDMRDRLMRLAAEMENLRKRTEREVKDSGQYAVTSFARDILAIGDNLQRAMEAVPAEQRANADESLAGLINGVEMTAREMHNILERHGVSKIDPKGEKFDPNVHQAMFEVPDEQMPSGMVVQVVQAGYMIAGRVLRPALVGVSKGGPAAATKSTDTQAGNAKPGEPTIDKNV